jgi:hypothetical protein
MAPIEVAISEVGADIVGGLHQGNCHSWNKNHGSKYQTVENPIVALRDGRLISFGEGVMRLNNCLRSIAAVVVPILRAPLATTIAIAIASLPSNGEANPIDQKIEEATDWTVPDQALPIDAFGYVGGLFEARFYQPHSTTDDPREEIGQAASLYGVDLPMMLSIAKVESDFNPRARTGSYKGLFQLSDYEFEKYGDGSILDARDNARATAHMFLIQAEKFKWALGHYPDYAERYMVHQQGIQGAVEHYTHPERVAWQSMCATDEGMLKGERWCKKCIWGNLLPEWKHGFGNVENISSGTSSACGQDASITSPTNSPERRASRL